MISTENFTYDAAGNITGAPESSFQYDTNNRLVMFNGNSVSYDLDGNMLNNGVQSFTYDSANRLITADGHTYTYNAEDVRIRNLCQDEDTTYTYDTNCRLSKLLTKTTNNTTTKYVYGRGLIGEEVNSTFKTYHFDCRGSTIAITDASGNITDTFAYDTYGKQIARTGTSEVIFGYNGRDGVVTDDNALIYMRARYYAPNMKRFVNADIVAGAISNAITLNRFAYANGNPVSFVDPFGLSIDSKGSYNPDVLFEIANKLQSQKDVKLVSQMLAVTLDQLLSYKKILSVSQKVTVEIPVGPNTTITYTNSFTIGDGNINVSATISDQLEIADSFNFPVADSGSVTISNDGSISIEDSNGGSITIGDDGIGIEYSAQIDEYNTIAASVSIDLEASISAGFTITTTDKYDNTVSTSIELSYKRGNDLLKQPEFVPVTIPEPAPVQVPRPVMGPSEGYYWGQGQKVAQILGATALSVFAVGALAETILTGGTGVWNDGWALSAAASAWANVFAH